MQRSMQRALISVSNKKNIINLAKSLNKMKIDILSTQGTAKVLKKNNISCIEISEYISYPEIMDGRLKTLHPKIYGGLLARNKLDETKYHIPIIDIIVVNLYPFDKIIKNPNNDINTIIENIDIGGVSMIRAAAKNYKNTLIIFDPYDYDFFIEKIKNNTINEKIKFLQARKAFEYIAKYDDIIANYFGIHDDFTLQHKEEQFPNTLNLQYTKIKNLRYGENPHQKAAFYIHNEYDSNNHTSIANSKLIQGKELSYNNIIDANTALECIKKCHVMNYCLCIIIKHENPCGVALDKEVVNAYNKAYKVDPISAYGGIIAFNKTVDLNTAITIIKNQFVEIIIAPDFSKESLMFLSNKTKLRLIIYKHENKYFNYGLHIKSIDQGLLIQTNDINNQNKINIVTRNKPNSQELKDLLFAWKVIEFVKSNAIIYVKNYITIGIGAGQSSRIFSAEIAINKAKKNNFNLHGSVMASDAFMPFTDTIEIAVKEGISAIIQPGGSIHDKEIIELANKYNISMIFTGKRKFKH